MISMNPMLIPGMRVKKPLPVFAGLKERIVKLTCEEFGSDLNKVFLKRRKREDVLSRQVSMFLIRKTDPHASLVSIGKYFSGRDHTTVIHAVNTVNNLMQFDELLRERVNKIQGLI